MGNVQSENSQYGGMAPGTRMRLPMPEAEELEKQFNKVLAKLDLPIDKERAMRQFDDEKKWDIVCDQELVAVRDPPSFYLDKLKAHMTMKGSKNKKLIGHQTSTQVLRDLEISLRTNHIQWVRDFLNEDNRGLDVLVEYLSFTQMLMQLPRGSRQGLDENAGSVLNNSKSVTMNNSMANHSTNHALANSSIANRDRVKRTKSMPGGHRPTHKQLKSRKVGDAFDDVHVCIMCLRAIMNHQHGFNLVIAHPDAINSVALALKHKSTRTRTLVLELLAAVCFVSGGHEIILRAFDNFKIVTGESRRFETLLHYYQFEDFHIEFMVACTQFMNIIVHSVENVNYRVHLQYELTSLGLDDFLESLKDNESERLITQVNAYMDNRLDVAQLLEDSDQKAAAVEELAGVSEELTQTIERLQEVENESMCKVADLQKQLQDRTTEIDNLSASVKTKEDVIGTLKRTMDEKEGSLKKTATEVEELKGKLETLKRSSSTKVMAAAGAPSAPVLGLPPPPPMAAAPPPPPPPPPPPMGGPPPPPPPPPGAGPPPPPPPPGMGGPPGPPPPPGMPGAPPMMGRMAAPSKRKIQTKYKLPTLNWAALKPGQVKGTVFAEIDDENILKAVDFAKFEEDFKLGINRAKTDMVDAASPNANNNRKMSKKPELLSLMDANRNRNASIVLRKITLTEQQIVAAITSLDHRSLGTEYIDLLHNILPNEQEVKAFNNYESDGKPLAALSPTDQFLIQLNHIERLQQKLSIMNYIANFSENITHLKPQLNSLLTASLSLRNSKKIRKILEIVLAFGNYMNSNKRGGAYGFKLETLDVLSEAKSTDKKITVLHYVASTVTDSFPDLVNFAVELDFMEKASLVSMENLQTDVSDLQKGMNLVKKEFQARTKGKQQDPNTMTYATKVLKEFLDSTGGDLEQVQKDYEAAKEGFVRAVEYYGADSKLTSPQSLFGIVARFSNSFKKAIADNEQRQKLQMQQQTQVAKETQAKKSQNAQAAMMSELKSNIGVKRPKDSRKIGKDEIYHGALEDILTGLKSQPYIRSDGARRSQKRHLENGSLVPVGGPSDRL